MSLLQILLSLQKNLGVEISACHYNHRLRAEESDGDEKFVKNFCKERGIECFLGRSPRKNKFKNEDEAREARYLFFQKILKGNRVDKIALAHNLNDLAETVLLRTIRGTGLRGIQSIPARREKFIRPLLPCRRTEIEDYLAGQNIKARIDKSNSDVRIPRNFIRLKVLPMILELNPNIVETLSLAAEAAKDDYNFLETEGQKLFDEIAISSHDKISLNLSAFKALSKSMQRMVIRLAIAKISNLNDISFKQIEEVLWLIEKGEGRKFKTLPRSLHIELQSGKIMLFIDNKETIDETQL